MKKRSNKDPFTYGKRKCHQRYKFEHAIFPYAAYESPNQLFRDLFSRREEVVLEMYKAAGKMMNWTPPYRASDFSVQPRLLDLNGEGCLVIDIQMPPAMEILDCRDVYLCFCPRIGKALYLTVERSLMNTYLLCGWTKERMHLNFGAIQPEEEFEQVVDLFKRLILDGGLDKILRITG